MKVADKDYFLDEEGNVTDDEAKAATVLIRQGQEMPADVEEKIGNVPAKKSGKVAQASEEAEEEAPKSAKPAANKKASPSSNKGVKK